MSTPIVRPLLLPTYLAMIRGSVQSRAYQHLYASVDGVPQDIVKGGAYACAFFVCHILLWFSLIQEPHSTVQGTLRDLRASGWEETSAPEPGDVIMWEVAQEAGEPHEHIGFFLGDDRAISNSTSQACPLEHHLTYGAHEDGSPARDIVAFYTHPRLRQREIGSE